MVKRRHGMDVAVGEATPDYIFHPHVPRRVARLMPNARLVVLLRNPVDRAYSHYWHQVHRGFEQLSFEEALEAEPERLAGELERVVRDDGYQSFRRHHFSYVTRGRYAEQLAWWTEVFPREQILVIRSEDMYADAGAVAERVQRFVGVPPRDLGPLPKYGSYSSGRMDPRTRAELVERFREPNRDLAALVGRDLEWDR